VVNFLQRKSKNKKKKKELCYNKLDIKFLGVHL